MFYKCFSWLGKDFYCLTSSTQARAEDLSGNAYNNASRSMDRRNPRVVWYGAWGHWIWKV